MTLADAAGTVADWSTAGTAVVALAALAVAVLARRDARRSAVAAERSAVAAEQSAEAAERSAVAEEAALELARRESEQLAAERHDRAGPDFVPIESILREHGDNEWTAVVLLRVDGGPERMNVYVEMATDGSFKALLYRSDKDAPDDGLHFDVVSGKTIRLLAPARWGPMPLDPDPQPPLLLRIVATAQDDPSQWWERRLRIDLQPEPQPRIW